MHLSDITIIIISFSIIIFVAFSIWKVWKIFQKTHTVNDNRIKVEYAKTVEKYNIIVDKNTELKQKIIDIKIKNQMEKTKVNKIKLKLENSKNEIAKLKLIIKNKNN